MTLKQRFLKAVSSGELGKPTEFGVIVTVLEFKAYFKDVNHEYLETFLPAAVIEPGRNEITSTRYVFRIKHGVYRVHTDALLAAQNELEAMGRKVGRVM